MAGPPIITAGALGHLGAVEVEGDLGQLVSHHRVVVAGSDQRVGGAVMQFAAARRQLHLIGHLAQQSMMEHVALVIEQGPDAAFVAPRQRLVEIDGLANHSGQNDGIEFAAQHGCHLRRVFERRR